MDKKKKLIAVFIFAIFLVSFFYRVYGLTDKNPPFWVDEFSSANQGKFFLWQRFAAFLNPNIVLEHYNITTHLLITLLFYLLFFFLTFVVYRISFIKGLISMLSYKTFLVNNLWYYHSFLWREYGLITFLGITGVMVGLSKKKKPFLLIIIFLISQLLFLSFIFKPYV